MKVSPARLKEVLDKLDFDRSNVSNAQKYEPDIKQAVEIIDGEKENLAGPDVVQEELAALYYKVTIWYLFCKREEVAARFADLYIQTFHEEAKQTLEYAEAWSFLGHAKTIDPSYKGLEPFETGRGICENLLLTEVDPEKKEKIERVLLFILRYMGLKYHRDSNNQQAQETFTRTRDLYLNLANGKPDIDAAECQHLYGVSLTRQKRYAEALTALRLALAMEQEYVSKVRDHFMFATTKQSIADANRCVAESNPEQAGFLLEEAMTLLDEAEEYQTKLWGDDKNKNADFAKTLQFKGDNFHARKMYVDAVREYLRTIEVKAKANEMKGGLTHDMVVYTQNTLTKTLKAINADANPQVMQTVKKLLDEKVATFGKIFISDNAHAELNILTQQCEKLKPASIASSGRSFGGFAAAPTKQTPTVAVGQVEQVEQSTSPTMSKGSVGN